MSLNTLHTLTLTEGQISTILYTMEGYMQGSDDAEDSQFHKDVDSVFEVLEGTIDKYYEELEKKKSKQPVMEWDDGFTYYNECVDKLVEDMNSSESVTQSQQ